MLKRNLRSQVLGVIATTAVVLFGVVPTGTAGVIKGPTTQNECKLIGGTASPAPGPQPNTFECCNHGSCYICSAKGCDPVDWGDVVISAKPRAPAANHTTRDHRASAQPQTYQAKAGAGTGYSDGGQCTVLSGTNKGKKGTFDEGYCCNEKSWGCTDCTSTSGKPNGKCQSKIQSSILERPAFSGFDAGRNRLIRTR